MEGRPWRVLHRFPSTKHRDESGRATSRARVGSRCLPRQRLPFSAAVGGCLAGVARQSPPAPAARGSTNATSAAPGPRPGAASTRPSWAFGEGAASFSPCSSWPSSTCSAS